MRPLVGAAARLRPPPLGYATARSVRRTTTSLTVHATATAVFLSLSFKCNRLGPLDGNLQLPLIRLCQSGHSIVPAVTQTVLFKYLCGLHNSRSARWRPRVNSSVVTRSTRHTVMTSWRCDELTGCRDEALSGVQLARSPGGKSGYMGDRLATIEMGW